MTVTKNIYVLLGGLAWNGIDGWVTSAGLLTFSRTLAKLPNTVVRTYTWGNWQSVISDIKASKANKNIVIGYSGGGSRATDVGQWLNPVIIDLMVLWDPSPSRQMLALFPNVKTVVCFHNIKPMMWVPFIGSLGGGDVALAPGNTTTIVKREIIAEQHLLVQLDPSIKSRTLTYVQNA